MIPFSVLRYCSTFSCWCLSAQEEFEDTKGVTSIRKSKDRQQNHKKGTYNNLQNTTHKTKDRAIRTSLKTGVVNSGAPEWWAGSAPLEQVYMCIKVLLSVYNIYKLLVNWWYLHGKTHFSKKGYECKWTWKIINISLRHKLR